MTLGRECIDWQCARGASREYLHRDISLSLFLLLSQCSEYTDWLNLSPTRELRSTQEYSVTVF